MNVSLDMEDKKTDVLQLTVEDWCEVLSNPAIFTDFLLEMLVYIYQQPNRESTATDIGNAFHLNYWAVTKRYVDASKEIYKQHSKKPQKGANEDPRYWNTMFVMLKDPKLQQFKRNGKKLYRLILRPNLIEALERLQLV